jgi:hypothetical protein
MKRLQRKGRTNNVNAETQVKKAIDSGCNQVQMAEIYAETLYRQDVNWAAVNRAIIARWKLAGLKRIKARAWKVNSGRPFLRPLKEAVSMPRIR